MCRFMIFDSNIIQKASNIFMSMSPGITASYFFDNIPIETPTKSNLTSNIQVLA